MNFVAERTPNISRVFMSRDHSRQASARTCVCVFVSSGRLGEYVFVVYVIFLHVVISHLTRVNIVILLI